jgi:hypothetical protein
MHVFVVESHPRGHTVCGTKLEPSDEHCVNTFPLHRSVPAVHIGATHIPFEQPPEQLPFTNRLKPSCEHVAVSAPLQTVVPGVQMAALGTQVLF